MKWIDLSRSRPQISKHSFQIKVNQNRPCLKLWITVTLPPLSEFWVTKIPAIKNAKRSHYPNINFHTCSFLTWFSLICFFFLLVIYQTVFLELSNFVQIYYISNIFQIVFIFFFFNILIYLNLYFFGVCFYFGKKLPVKFFIFFKIT